LAAEILLVEDSISGGTPVTRVEDSDDSPAAVCYQEFASLIRSKSLATLFNEELVRNQLVFFFTALLQTHVTALPNNIVELVKNLRVLFVKVVANQKRHKEACNYGSTLST
jgi:hypothetical protein